MKRAMASLAVVSILLLAGCRHKLWFPEKPLSQVEGEDGIEVSYDTNCDGRADYFAFIGPDGRKSVIAYDFSGDGQPDSFVNLDEMPVSQCRHLVIILDGFPYEQVKEFYDAGHFRFFHPPSRVVAPFPSMTDLAISDALDQIPCPSYQSEYYDRRKGRQTNGEWDYLRGRNEPWIADTDYRGALVLDPFGYISPWQLFKKEVAGVHSLYNRRDRTELIAYFIASAGMGTSNGDEGRARCLALIERLVEQVIYESRGLVKVTMFADHGHTCRPFKDAELSAYLKKKGWRVTGSLKKDNDVVNIKFGLVTYAAFMTRNAPKLAQDLADAETVDLAAYMVPRGVAVVSSRGSAVIREKNGNFSYEAADGDPLVLKDIIVKLRTEGKVDAEGFVDDRALFDATVTHEYPDPLRRLWRAFYGLVENVPDVVASLKDEYYSGSGGLAFFAKKASTHGSLNYKNSVTFIMSTAGPLPAAMRSDDIPRHLSALFNRPFPYRR